MNETVWPLSCQIGGEQSEQASLLTAYYLLHLSYVKLCVEVNIEPHLFRQCFNAVDLATVRAFSLYEIRCSSRRFSSSGTQPNLEFLWKTWLVKQNQSGGSGGQCHKPGKPGVLRDFSEHGKLREFCATSRKNCNKQSIFSSVIQVFV